MENGGRKISCRLINFCLLKLQIAFKPKQTAHPSNIQLLPPLLSTPSSQLFHLTSSSLPPAFPAYGFRLLQAMMSHFTFLSAVSKDLLNVSKTLGHFFFQKYLCFSRSPVGRPQWHFQKALCGAGAQGTAVQRGALNPYVLFKIPACCSDAIHSENETSAY